MFKTLIAGVTAVALTVTSAGAASAQEFNEDDFGKFLFGLVAAAALGTFISNQRDDDDHDEADWDRGGRIGGFEPRALPDHRAPVVNNSPRWDGYINPPRSDRPRTHAPRVNQPRSHAPRPRANAALLPRQCLRNIETRFGNTRMFTQRCLNRNYRHVDTLPNRCAVRVYGTQGVRQGYDPLCLRQQGFRAARRH